MIGMIARMDRSGLGQGQTLRLAKLLNPDKVMLIDSTPFNKSVQHPEWYAGYDTMTIIGFPNDLQIRKFLTSLDVVITCETFYNNHFTSIAIDMGVKTICIANPEFWDWFKPQFLALIPLPDKVIVPSWWKFSEMRHKFNAEYLPTPIFDDEFKETREINIARPQTVTRWSKFDSPKPKTKYLFMNGKTAAHDRNGLESLYEALQISKGDFTVTVKAQDDVKKHPDPRLIYDFANPESQAELYKGFDALILPRRYGGQALSMCEALMCGLSVVMTSIEPNNLVLPEEWLIPAAKTGEFMTRMMIDIYSAHSYSLASTLDKGFSRNDKLKAVEIGREYDAETLRPKYEALLSSL